MLLQHTNMIFMKMPLRSHISALKEYRGSYGAYYIQDFFFIKL